MIDFTDYLNKKEDKISFDLEAFYAGLDAKGTHTEPRPAQREALRDLTIRHAERDIVLKISTGAGKTTVGLLFLYGHMKISKLPSVYLCPTTQLVSQVLAEAQRLGIEARHYGGGEPIPAAECVRGDAIIVCTYEKMFNARTTFMRQDVNLVANAVVLDDAHAGVEAIRKQFTLKIRDKAFVELKRILETRCKAYHESIWGDLQGETPALLEVPHWIWSDARQQVVEAFSSFASTDAFALVWPYLRDRLPLCRCILSNHGAEIVPEVPPVDLVRPYDKAAHRLFMSATLADDSVLVREIGVDAKAAQLPIMPPSDRGLGERMVLAPSLVDPSLDRAYVMKLCADLSKSYNVVVLTSSDRLAKDWVSFGATFFPNEQFSGGVQKLQNNSSGMRFAVFAQRYDGVDLPDDSCRVLVIDGTPYGESLADKMDARMTGSARGARNRTIYRIEQGMGRAVRSHKDFAAVLLAGADLTALVGRQDALEAMTADTRNQLKLSVELAEIARKEHADPGATVRSLVLQCVERNEGWKKFYNQRIRNVAHAPFASDKSRLELALAERDAYILAATNRAMDGKTRLHKAIDDVALQEEELGIYLQRLARITYQIDPGESMKLQQSARLKNYAASMPPELPRQVLSAGSKTTAQKVALWISQFNPLTAAIVEAQRIVAKLDLGGNFRTVEAGFLELGRLIGADASAPDSEFSEGPDCLWLLNGTAYVIEAKNENVKSLHKKDAGQMHVSVEWVKRHYPQYAGKIQPVVIAKVTGLDHDALYLEGTRVVTGEDCQKIGTALVQFLNKVAQEGPLFATPDNIHAQLQAFGLLNEQFFAKFGRKLR
ncbi:helicase C-terminal domain-containing protein [Caballeronia sp. LP006]|uniref:DEAD/DEAH box helicase n=1 Tax=Caballeronia sp. LP006 TaxID=3038552 RepID=UPI002856AF73|nr:DEAD/DEAH box helicase [Caballeronia sp. LP006]MDR5832501.1 helicase C-terminal domain-containing protein [Caballeronia sp. LP006]